MSATLPSETGHLETTASEIATGLTIAVRYLTGYAVAAQPSGEPEWPPHPARLFMALLAGCDDSSDESEQLEALRWLEALPAPDIFASEGDKRSQVVTYVPPNDFAAKDPNILPSFRFKRQPRTFARIRPHHETVCFFWKAAPCHNEVLTELCEKVTRLGHSTSLVEVRWQPGSPDSLITAEHQHYRPTEAGLQRMRTMQPGMLDYLLQSYRDKEIDLHFDLHEKLLALKGAKRADLAQTYEQRLGRPWSKSMPAPDRLRPELASAQAYDRMGIAQASSQGSCFSPSLILLRLEPLEDKTRFRRLAPETTAYACEVLRKAIVEKAPDNITLIHGHAPDGSALQAPHMAVFPLPSTGMKAYNEGHLLGLGIALPRVCAPHEQHAVFDAILQIQTLRLGQLGEWRIAPVTFDDAHRGLQPSLWVGSSPGATSWATVTPIALDRHPKTKDPIAYQDEVAEQIRHACEAIDLPPPQRVVPFPVSVFTGLPDAGRFPRLKRKDGSQRRQTHARLWFEKPIIGPVLLGAGRFRGWGLCRPYQEYA